MLRGYINCEHLTILTRKLGSKTIYCDGQNFGKSLYIPFPVAYGCLKLPVTTMYSILHLQGVPGGMCQISGGYSLC